MAHRITTNTEIKFAGHYMLIQRPMQWMRNVDWYHK